MKILITFTLLLVITFSFSKRGSATELSNTEKKGMQLMREEEKLAHEVYLFLSEKWTLPIFFHISQSEARHFEAIGFLLDQFKIEDPAFSEQGKFQNQQIASLYDSLTLAGSASLIEALKVGAFIEEFDIADLQKLLAGKSEKTIEAVYQNLLRGSNNHLRAFTSQLERRGEIYKPVILNETAFREVVQGQHQMGGRNANYVLQQNNCLIQQNVKPAGNRGKGRMHRRRGW